MEFSRLYDSVVSSHSGYLKTKTEVKYASVSRRSRKLVKSNLRDLLLPKFKFFRLKHQNKN